MELLLVLALLAMAVAISAPSLSRFFHGRTLDSEARRMLALTHYAQSRAVSEGVPMIVWFRPEGNSYGLQAEISYAERDPMAITNQLSSDLKIELDPVGKSETVTWKATTQIAGRYPAIRFMPDGFISETSPLWVWIQQANEDEEDAAWLVMNDSHVNYELQNFQPVIVR